MKIWSIAITGVLGMALMLGSSTAAEKGKEVTLSGKLVCGKCTLKETPACSNVLQVKDGAKTVNYYLADAAKKAPYHGAICPKNATVDATVGVELRFPPAAEYVRTARLVAVAVARRSGLGESQLDELRLAVGEACARAVRRCRQAGCDRPVRMFVDDTAPVLVIEVTDSSGVTDEPEPVVLALLQGLADAVEVLPDARAGTSCVRLEWWPGSHQQ